MGQSVTGELVWKKVGDTISVGLYLSPSAHKAFFPYQRAQVSNLEVPVWTVKPLKRIVYRQPITVTKEGDGLHAGPIFAILAASGGNSFLGSRANFRDLTRAATEQGSFLYVLPAIEVRDEPTWMGYVRVGYQKWIPIPCPRPEAVYNRIPNRALERSPESLSAKARLQSERIPLFNPDYFNKANIYNALHTAGLSNYLPDTVNHFSMRDLQSMLSRHRAVYLKPAGGSIGHGMIRVSRQGNHFKISVLKHSRCQTWEVQGMADMFEMVRRQRLPGHYVIQEAIPLILWQGRACDFRVLLQKQRGVWHVVGTGVRVSGENTITTHVPNGGYIASAKRVLAGVFGERHGEVAKRLEDMVVACAEAIDAHYHSELGEMSMDIGLDMAGNPWFFEANAKPMKFDEKDIRQKSLVGVLAHLEELRQHRILP